MFVGYVLLKKPFNLKKVWFSIRKKSIEYSVKKDEAIQAKRKNLEKELNIVLDKINREGYNSLTKDEQDALYKNSKLLFKNKKKN